MSRVKSFKLRKGTGINGYTICERLGSGWEGEVYRVREDYSQGERVLKLFDPSQYRSKHMTKYCPKLEKLSAIPGIIRFYHTGHWEPRDCYYLVMEYVSGVPLQRAISRRPLPLFKALRVVRDLLRVVRACHDSRCCVGDIHSDNIILATTDRPYIIDVDLGSKLTRRTAADDRTAVCKLLYELTWNTGPYPADLRHALPKRADALATKYNSTSSILSALDALMGRDTA